MANEPDIHYPFLFNYFKGEEWRTQKEVRRLVDISIIKMLLMVFREMMIVEHYRRGWYTSYDGNVSCLSG